MMSLRAILTTSLLLWSGTSATPLQSQYANMTTLTSTSTSTSTLTIVPSASANNSSCPASCSVSGIARRAYSWSSYIKVQTAATVLVVIDDNDGTTKTTTNYEQSLLINGTIPANSISRTDTDSAGTVTEVLNLKSTTLTLTYPTPYYWTAESYPFSGQLPYTSNGVVTCISTDGPSAPLPPHTPWPTSTATVDPQDKAGHLYTLLVDYSRIVPLGGAWAAAEFPGAVVDVAFRSCSWTIDGPIQIASGVSYLTETSTARISNTAAAVSATSLRPAATAALSPPAQSSNPAQAEPAIQPEPSPVNSPSAAAPVPVLQPSIASPSAVRPSEVVADGSGRGPVPPPAPVDTSPSSSTRLLQAPAPAAPAGTEFTSGFVQSSQTLVPGGLPIIVSGTQISLPAQGPSQTSGTPGAVVVPPSNPSAPVSPNLPTDQPAPPPAAAPYIIDSQTLSPGGTPVTVAGTQVSLAPSGNAMVVGTGDGAQTVTSNIQIYVTNNLGGTQPPAPIPTIDAAGAGAGSGSESGSESESAPSSPPTYIIASQTLAPGGPAITVSGTPLSLPAGESGIVVGTGLDASTETADVNGYVSSLSRSVQPGPTGTDTVDAAGRGSATVSAGVQEYTGGAARSVGRIKSLLGPVAWGFVVWGVSSILSHEFSI